MMRSSPDRGLAETVRFQRRAYERAVMVVRAFYVVSLTWTVMSMGSWPTLLNVDRLYPKWPLFWVDGADPGRSIGLILFCFGISSLVVAIAPQFRVFRLFYALSLLEYMAVINGFGKVNHNLHGWLFVSLVLVFLPTGRWTGENRVTSRQPFLNTFWVAQVMVLFFYFLTGLWKLAYGVHDLSTPRLSAFQLPSFSLLVASRLLETSQQTIMGEWLIRHEAIGWMLFNGTMYLEIGALIVAFRPRLHQVWGAGLILFHLGTQLAMGFTFLQNVALVGLLFICSPVAPERFDPVAAVLDLPGIHIVSGWIRRRRGRSASSPGGGSHGVGDDLPAV